MHPYIVFIASCRNLYLIILGGWSTPSARTKSQKGFIFHELGNLLSHFGPWTKSWNCFYFFTTINMQPTRAWTSATGWVRKWKRPKVQFTSSFIPPEIPINPIKEHSPTKKHVFWGIPRCLFSLHRFFVFFRFFTKGHPHGWNEQKWVSGYWATHVIPTPRSEWWLSTFTDSDQTSGKFNLFYCSNLFYMFPRALGIQSPKLRMLMEPKYLSFRRWLYTPCSSSDKVIGSIGVIFICLCEIICPLLVWNPVISALILRT